MYDETTDCSAGSQIKHSCRSNRDRKVKIKSQMARKGTYITLENIRNMEFDRPIAMGQKSATLEFLVNSHRESGRQKFLVNRQSGRQEFLVNRQSDRQEFLVNRQSGRQEFFGEQTVW
jgi:hypothetical protein